MAAALVAGQSQAATYMAQARAMNFDQALARKIEAAGGQVVARYPQIGVAIVEAAGQFASRTARMSELQSTTRDRVLQFEIPESVPLGLSAAASPPNTGDDDFLFDTQWVFDAINAPEAWQAGHRGAGATVAVLDSGLDCTHPDLTPNMLGALNASFPASTRSSATAGSTRRSRCADRLNCLAGCCADAHFGGRPLLRCWCPAAREDGAWSSPVHRGAHAIIVR